jgi:hypothetical protein
MAPNRTPSFRIGCRHGLLFVYTRVPGEVEALRTPTIERTCRVCASVLKVYPQGGKATGLAKYCSICQHMQAYSNSSTEWLSWPRRFLGLFLS